MTLEGCFELFLMSRGGYLMFDRRFSLVLVIVFGFPLPHLRILGHTPPNPWEPSFGPFEQWYKCYSCLPTGSIGSLNLKRFCLYSTKDTIVCTAAEADKDSRT